MSSVERDSLKLRFFHASFAGLSIYCKIFTPVVESPANSTYDVRIDILDLKTRQPLITLQTPCSKNTILRVLSVIYSHKQRSITSQNT